MARTTAPRHRTTTLDIDGEELDAPAGTLVFLPEPEARRASLRGMSGFPAVEHA